LANIRFQTVFYHIGLEPKHTVRRYASVMWNSGKWNSVKWNETRRIGAILHAFTSCGFVSVSWAFLLLDSYNVHDDTFQLMSDTFQLMSVIYSEIRWLVSQWTVPLDVTQSHGVGRHWEESLLDESTQATCLWSVIWNSAKWNWSENWWSEKT